MFVCLFVCCKKKKMKRKGSNYILHTTHKQKWYSTNHDRSDIKYQNMAAKRCETSNGYNMWHWDENVCEKCAKRTDREQRKSCGISIDNNTWW